jgi:hypothetical protein
MTVWARAVEDRMANLGACGSASAASANSLFRLFQVLLRAYGREVIIKKNRAIPCGKNILRYAFIR